jgi:hypothetical protein
MTTAPRRPELTDAEASAIQDHAEEIHRLAAPLSKHYRHPMSAAARLIRWLAYEAEHPGDADALEAIKVLCKSLGEHEHS